MESTVRQAALVPLGWAVEPEARLRLVAQLPGQRNEPVQDRMRTSAGEIAALLGGDLGHVFIRGLEGMEAGVDDALGGICRENGLDWRALKSQMRASWRYHVETWQGQAKQEVPPEPA